MGFLTKSKTDEEVDINEYSEMAYERLFNKIGRDFIYREDFENIISELLTALSSNGFVYGIDISQQTAAQNRALLYKQNLESGTRLSNKYEDLIEWD